jgi:hypothetical protein
LLFVLSINDAPSNSRASVMMINVFLLIAITLLSNGL